MKNKCLIKNVLIILIAVFIILFMLKEIKKPETKPVSDNTVANENVSDKSELPGIQVSQGVWINEIVHLKERLNAIGLPALSVEGTAMHIHQHLDIFIHGKPISVPADIGVNPFAGFISPIHTHDDSAIVHVESPTVQNFTLGQFFDIWGLKLTRDSIGGYNSDTQNKLQVFVNGKESIVSPREIILAAHQEIVITFGTGSELPKVIPSGYGFPVGE